MTTSVSPSAQLFRRIVIAGDDSTLHDKFDVFEDGNVFQRIAFDGDDVCPITGFERPCFSANSNEVRGIESRGANGVNGPHAPFDHFCELLCVIAVRIDAGIGSEGHFCAFDKRVMEILALEATHFLFLFDGFGKHSSFCTFLQDEIVVVNVEDEKGAVLLGEGDAFIVDQAGMLDGIDASSDGVLDGLRAVSVSGDFPRGCSAKRRAGRLC